MAVKIQYRRGTASEWTSANPTLAQGEPGYETDTGKFKVGDGSTAWTSLAYMVNVFSVDGQTGTVDLSSVYQPLDSDLTAFAAKTAPTGAVVGTSDTQTLTSKTIEAGTFTNGYTEETYSANSSTAITISLANGSMQFITLTGSPTITMPAAAAGKSFTLILYTGSGSYTVSWSTVAWASGSAPTITTTASKKDILNFYSDGTNWYGSIFGQNF